MKYSYKKWVSDHKRHQLKEGVTSSDIKTGNDVFLTINKGLTSGHIILKEITLNDLCQEEIVFLPKYETRNLETFLLKITLFFVLLCYTF